MIVDGDSSPMPLLSVVQVVGRTILAGRLAGQGDCPLLVAAARQVPGGSPFVLDLAGVEVISASYFSAALWPLWSLNEPEVYPVLANIPADGVDDILLVLKDQNAAVWRERSALPRGHAPELLGTLDPPLKTTLQFVLEKGEATAADLFESDRTIGVTAWSNRLAALYQIRILRRRKDGRRLIYAPSWKEQYHG
ncbi:hypothetical protein QHF83_45830 [Polyangium sp. 15x6]|nr:hypothetical protein [Polyangium sp. 15x6]